MRPRQKGNTRGSGATNPRKLAGDLAQPEFGAATFSECGRGRMGGVICSRAGVLSEGRTQDLTRYFQSLDTDSCELIAIDHPRRAIFAQHRNSDDAFARIFWSPVLHHSRPRMCLQPEKRKSLSMPNCGMRVAMDIGVIRDHVSRVYRYFWRAGYDVLKRIYVQRHGGTIGPLRRSERAGSVG